MTDVLVSFGVKCIVCFKKHLEHVNIRKKKIETDVKCVTILVCLIFEFNRT